MANLLVRDGNDDSQYLKASGAGTLGDPIVPFHSIQTMASGASPDIGAVTDTAVVTDANGTMLGKLRGLVKWAFERMPASLGQKTMSASLPVVISSDQSSLPVTVGNLTISSISGGASPDIGATNDAAVTTDANGSIQGKLRGLVKWTSERMPASLGQHVKAASFPVVISSDQDSLPVTVGNLVIDTITAGASVDVGAITDAAIVTDADGSLSGKLRGLVKWAFERMPASLGQKTKAGSISVTIASDEGNVLTDTIVTTISAGASVDIGALADAAVVTDTSGSLSGKLRGLVKWSAERMPATLGQKTMTASFPVVISSDQSTFPVTVGALTIATFNAGASADIGALNDAAVVTDANGSILGKLRGLVKWAFERMPAALGQTTMSASLPVTIASNQTALDVSIISGGSSGTQYTEDAASAADPIGTVLISRRRDALSGAEVSADGDNIAINATAKGELYVKHVDPVGVTGSFYQATQPVSLASIPLATGAALDGTDISSPTAMPSGGVGIRGWLSAIWTKLNGDLTVTASAGTNLNTSALALETGGHLASLDTKTTACNTGAVVIASSALPSGAATLAKQPALGTAGTASADVITIQGIASMTPLKTDGSGFTQPVSHNTTTTNSGTKNVTTAGTAVQLASNTAAKWVIVQAKTTNTSTIAVGDSSTLATALSGPGISLVAGQAVTLLIANLNTVYIDSLVNGEGVRFTYGA